MATLDLPEKQVLIDYFDDPDGYLWHHRLLVEPTPVAGVWIGCTPDFGIERIDLNAHRVRMLTRNTPFPNDLAGTVYVFDHDLPHEDYLRIKQQCRDLMNVLGIAAPAAPAPAAPGAWRVADPSASCFADEVPAQIVADDTQFMQPPDQANADYPSALAFIDETWMHCHYVSPEKLDVWRRSRVCGLGHDDRLLADVRDLSGARFMPFPRASELIHSVTTASFPLGGSRAASEYILALRSANMEFMSHHTDFIHRSGISHSSGSARAHRRTSEALSHMLTRDLCNLGVLSSAEVLIRYLVEIETAVARNPRCPDYQDLEVMATTHLNATGGLVVPSYQAYVAGLQRDEAFLLKQRRLQ